MYRLLLTWIAGLCLTPPLLAAPPAAEIQPPQLPPDLTPAQEEKVVKFYQSLYLGLNGRADTHYAIVVCETKVEAGPQPLTAWLLPLGLLWDAATLPAQLADRRFPGFLKSNPDLDPDYKITEEYRIKILEGKKAAADWLFLQYYDIAVNPPKPGNQRQLQWMEGGKGSSEKHVKANLERLHRKAVQHNPPLARKLREFLDAPP